MAARPIAPENLVAATIRAGRVSRSMIPSLRMFLPTLAASATVANHFLPPGKNVVILVPSLLVLVILFAILTQKRLDRAYDPVSAALADGSGSQVDPEMIGPLLDYIQGGLTLGKDVVNATDRLQELLSSLRARSTVTLNRRQLFVLHSMVVEPRVDRQLREASLKKKREVSSKLRMASITALGIVGTKESKKLLARFIETCDDRAQATAAKRSSAQIDART